MPGLMIGSANAGFDIFDDDQEYEKRPNGTIDASDFIIDIREYDVPYHVRVAIDKGSLMNHVLEILLTDYRYTYWKVVYSRGKTRSCLHDMYRRPPYTCGSCCYGV